MHLAVHTCAAWNANTHKHGAFLNVKLWVFETPQPIPTPLTTSLNVFCLNFTFQLVATGALTTEFNGVEVKRYL